MDKDATKRLLRDAGLAVAPFACVQVGDDVDGDALLARLGLPLFVKPANQGSSVGVSRCATAPGSMPLALAFEYDHKVLVESAIVGREIECAVLGRRAPAGQHRRRGGAARRVLRLRDQVHQRARRRGGGAGGHRRCRARARPRRGAAGLRA
jgi:hypothetical protein